MSRKPIAIASDHAGYDLKSLLARELADMGYQVVDLGTDCRDIVGALRGQVGDRRYQATIESLVICPERCPGPGRVEAQIEGEQRDRTLTVRFDGSNRAQVTGWSGREFEVDLVCGEDE